MPSSQGPQPGVRRWRLLSSHGLLLFYVGMRPGCTAAEISEALSLTYRTIWGTLGDLRRAGMINSCKDGRRNRYSVNYGARVGISLVPEGSELRHMLRFLADRTLALLDEDEGLGGADRRSSGQR